MKYLGVFLLCMIIVAVGVSVMYIWTSDNYDQLQYEINNPSVVLMNEYQAEYIIDNNADKIITKTDKLIIETNGKRLEMSSMLDGVLAGSNNEIEIDKIKNKWKLTYRFQKNSEKFYTVRVDFGEPFTIGNWSVWTEKLTYNFMDAINAGYVTTVEADGNVAVIKYDISKMPNGAVEIDPFIAIETGNQQGSSPVVIDNNVYVFYVNRSEEACAYWTSSGGEKNCTGYGQPGATDSVFAFNFSSDYNRLIATNLVSPQAMNIYNISADGVLSDVTVITNTNQDLITDAALWNGDLWLVSGYLDSLSIANESSDYTWHEFSSLDRTGGSNYGFLVNLSDGLSMFAGTTSNAIWEFYTTNGITWSNRSIHNGTIGHGLDAVLFENTKYVFWSNHSAADGGAGKGGSLFYTYNTTAKGYETSQVLFNPTSQANESVVNVWAVTSGDILNVFFITFSGTASDSNMSMYNMTFDGIDWTDANLAMSSLYDYDGQGIQNFNFANIVYDDRFYATTVLSRTAAEGGDGGFDVFLWNVSVTGETTPAYASVINISISHPVNGYIYTEGKLDLNFTIKGNGTEYNTYTYLDEVLLFVGSVNNNTPTQIVMNSISQGSHTARIVAENYGVNSSNITSFNTTYYNITNEGFTLINYEGNYSVYNISIVNTSSWTKGIDAVFVFDNKEYSSTKVNSGNRTWFNASIPTPLGLNGSAFNFNWTINVTYKDTNTTLIKTGTRNLTSYQSYFLNDDNVTISPTQLIEGNLYDANTNITVPGNYSWNSIISTVSVGGSSETGTLVTNGIYWIDFSVTNNAPQIDDSSFNKTYNVTSRFNVTDDNGYSRILEGNTTLTIDRIAILPYGGLGTPTLNFTLVDSFTGNNLSGVGVTFQINVLSLEQYGGSVSRSYTYYNGSLHSYLFNIYPNNTWHKIYANVRATAPGYNTNDYTVNNINITNVTQYIQMQMINTTGTTQTELSIIVQNDAFVPLISKWVHVYEKNAITGVYTQLYAKQTDQNGIVIVDLAKGASKTYKIKVYDQTDTTLLKDTGDVSFTSDQPSFIVYIERLFFDISNVNVYCYTNSARTSFNCTINDYSHTATQTLMEILYLHNFQLTTYASFSESSYYASFLSTLGSNSTYYKYTIWMDTPNGRLVVKTGDITSLPGPAGDTPAGNIGATGLFICLMLMIMMVFLFIKSPSTSLAAAAAVLIICQVAGIINIDQTAIAGIVFLAGIAIVKMGGYGG